LTEQLGPRLRALDFVPGVGSTANNDESPASIRFHL
jgi:hypothetical protein